MKPYDMNELYFIRQIEVNFFLFLSFSLFMVYQKDVLLHLHTCALIPLNKVSSHASNMWTFIQNHHLMIKYISLNAKHTHTANLIRLKVEWLVFATITIAMVWNSMRCKQTTDVCVCVSMDVFLCQTTAA